MRSVYAIMFLLTVAPALAQSPRSTPSESTIREVITHAKADCDIVLDPIDYGLAKLTATFIDAGIAAGELGESVAQSICVAVATTGGRRVPQFHRASVLIVVVNDIPVRFDRP